MTTESVMPSNHLILFRPLLLLLSIFPSIRVFSSESVLCIRWPKYQFSSVAQSCPTLRNPMNRRTPGLPVHHQLLEFTQIHVQLFVTPWTVTHYAPLSMEFSSQEYWSGLPFPFPGDLPNPGIEPESSSLQVDSLLSELHEKP